jgi:3-isopropylmalate dehydrogenase
VAALITVLPGDGIGPEIMRQALRVLEAAGDAAGQSFEVREALIGGAAMDATGDPFPADTRALCREADAVLLGAVGGPKWSDPNAKVRPEQGLLDMRAAMQVYANLRPVKTHPALFGASPLKPEFLEGVDILVVRELTGGVYFGEKSRDANSARDLCTYTREEIERVVRMAAELARGRRGQVASVDKANVMDTSRLWRSVISEIYAQDYSDVQLEHVLADAAMMHLLSRPAAFDVIVTENLFGDLLTDEASMLSGSLGMLPSASLNADRRGLYEPIHGSAPDIAGKGIANPCGTILSVAMLLRYSLDMDDVARRIEDAVFAAVASGHRTGDIVEPGAQGISTAAMGDAVLAAFAASA